MSRELPKERHWGCLHMTVSMECIFSQQGFFYYEFGFKCQHLDLMNAIRAYHLGISHNMLLHKALF